MDEPIVFAGLDDLIDRISELEDSDDWIYVNVDQLQRDAYECRYYYLPEEWILDLPPDEVYTDGEGLEMPETYRDLGLRGWRLASDVAGVIGHVRDDVDPGSDVEFKAAVVDRLQQWEDDEPSWRR
jgi:hypothetical protein